MPEFGEYRGSSFNIFGYFRVYSRSGEFPDEPNPALSNGTGHKRPIFECKRQRIVQIIRAQCMHHENDIFDRSGDGANRLEVEKNCGETVTARYTASGWFQPD